MAPHLAKMTEKKLIPGLTIKHWDESANGFPVVSIAVVIRARGRGVLVERETESGAKIKYRIARNDVIKN